MCVRCVVCTLSLIFVNLSRPGPLLPGQRDVSLIPCTLLHTPLHSTLILLILAVVFVHVHCTFDFISLFQSSHKPPCLSLLSLFAKYKLKKHIKMQTYIFLLYLCVSMYELSTTSFSVFFLLNINKNNKKYAF